MSDSQEGFRKGRSTNRAVAHLQLLLEDAHEAQKNIYITYLDLKGAYPSVDHGQLQQIMQDLGIPRDVRELIAGLHKGACTSFLTPHGPTPPIPIHRGTLQGDPLSPILFDLAMEPLTRWLQQGNHGYAPASTHNRHEGILYADDVTLTTQTIVGMQQQLQKVDLYGEWSHIRVNPNKCRTTAWIPALQSHKNHIKEQALKNSLAHLRIRNTQIQPLGQDEPLPGGYLGCQITASLSSGPQKQWLNSILKTAMEAIKAAPVSIHTKVSLIHYLSYSKIRHTMGQMLYNFEFLQRMDSAIATMIKEAWKLPRYLPTAAVQCSKQELGLDSPSLTMDYSAAAAALIPALLNDAGRLGDLARASLKKQQYNKIRWPMEIALDNQIGFMGKAQALLQQAGILIAGFDKSWQGNPLCEALISHVKTEESDPENPKYPHPRIICRRLQPLWIKGINRMEMLLKPGPTTLAPPYILTYQDLKRAYPGSADSTDVKQALQYLTDLLTANSAEQFSNNRSKTRTMGRPSLLVADRWLKGESPLPVPTTAPAPRQLRTQTEALQTKRHKTSSQTIPPTPRKTADLITHICAPHNMSSSTQTTTIPKRITIYPTTLVSTQTINPERDAKPG